MKGLILMSTEFAKQAAAAAEELLKQAHLTPGALLVVGCSSSEILGETIGTHSAYEVGEAVFEAINAVCQKAGVFLAAQCCEHLNRALILGRDAALTRGYPMVNAVPQPKAGGSFATAAYRNMAYPVTVEHIKADAGLDIGGTLIGMHLKEVAVPCRLQEKFIGSAILLAARTRPKFIGGERAHYDPELQ